MVIRLIAVLIVSLFAAAACGDDDSSSDVGGTPTPSVCDERNALQQSVEDLAQLNVIAVGTDGLNAATERVKSDAQNLATVVSADVADEAAALTAAIELADATFSTLDDQESLLAATAEVALAIASVAVTGDDLVKALSTECD